MATLFGGRRKPKVISRREREDDGDEDGDQDTGPVVRRPTSNLPKNKSRLRVSFNPGGDGDDQESNRDTGRSTVQQSGSAPSSTITPHKPPRLGLSNAATQVLQNRSTDRDLEDDGNEGGRSSNIGRPTYNKAYLDELRNSTPSTPRDLSLSRDDSPSLDLVDPARETSSTALSLDLESKFGKSASSSRIPSLAEIREKKERRARLAKEQAALSSSGGGQSSTDFVSLEDYDSDGEFKPRRMQVGSYNPASDNIYREKNTRLVHEDEDIAEGFDSFVEDAGRVTLSRKGLKEQSRRDRDAIRTMIEEAEGSGGRQHKHDDVNYEMDSNNSNSDAGSDSDYELHQAYELSQTHHGMDGLKSHRSHTRQANRPRQPRETATIPKLSVGLSRLREMVSSLEMERARILKRRADIRAEQVDVVASQKHIQSSLEEAGQELEAVTAKARGVEQTSNGDPSTTVVGDGVSTGVPNANGSSRYQNPLPERGLESFGSTPEHVS
ncbi:hypothetical protein B0A52_09523 [Exophiala mesophila]|uniref:Uncharacterized protein n=1 Tax=Exophiala mesophila TaxID=212818 RepID=A0A438MV30_EXOME|nr:hypothetical protein B0A52_09523 [Exophiala mesophila]